MSRRLTLKLSTMEKQNWNLTENPFSPETEDEETIITTQPSSQSARLE